MNAEELDAHFQSLADRWNEESRVPRRGELPEQVYHYTDAGGLNGILSSHTIWATDHRFLNDKTESAYTKQVQQKIIQDLNAKDMLEVSFCSEMQRYSRLPINDDIFLFSLSEKRDDLSQWRGYAREGQGFTLGFDASALHDEARKEDSEYSFYKIVYDQSVQTNHIKKMITDFLKELRKVEPDFSDKSQLAKIAAWKADWVIDNMSLRNKHYSFKSEDEWRIVCFSERVDSEGHVRVSGLRLIPFMSLKPRADGGNLLPILSIGVGPGFDDPEAVRDTVDKLSKSQGYKVDIYLADTPYRRL